MAILVIVSRSGGDQAEAMNISTTTIPLITGANRGLGRALVDEALARGVTRLYAAARQPETIPDDPRVIRLALDLTKPSMIRELAAAAGDVNLLINNAGAATFAPALDATADAAAEEMAVNYTGLLSMVQVFAPVLAANRGAVVNVLSMLSLAPVPGMAGYSASKAAAHSLTLAIRPALGQLGVSVHGVYPGGIDTEMLAGIDQPKAAPADVAAAVFDAVGTGAEVIFPDPLSATMGPLWAKDPQEFTRQFLALR
jgi:NAD(P)-dependent dehydrogenase (short-subunit alcohol dehydrogenase family)